MRLTFQLSDSAATHRLGEQLATSLPPSAVVFLYGDLGVGKSTLARAMLRALGVVGPIKSPTYTLIERYSLAEGEAVHLDLYRIAAASELDFLGLDELANTAKLWLVEWPERGGQALSAPDITIHLTIEGDGRRAELNSQSDRGQMWLGRL